MIDKKCDVILSNLDYDDIMLISDLMQGSEDPAVHKLARKINKNLTIVRKIDLPLVKAFHKQVKKSGIFEHKANYSLSGLTCDNEICHGSRNDNQ